MSEHQVIPSGTGNLDLHFTDANHVYVSSPRGESLTANRVQYHVGCHLHKWADGTWNIGQEEQSEYERRAGLHATRVDWTKVSDMYPSKAAQEKLADSIKTSVRDFIVNNPGILHAAQLEHLQNLVEKAEAEERGTRVTHGLAVLALEVAKQVLHNHDEGILRGESRNANTVQVTSPE